MQCRSDHPRFSNPNLVNLRFRSPRRGPDVLPSLSSRDHRTAAAMGGRVSARSLCDSFLLQLLVGLVLARDGFLLDSAQLPPTPAGEYLRANAVSLDVDRGASDD